MNNNLQYKLFKFIIIGASKAGIEAVKYISNKCSKMADIAFISTHFNNLDTTDLNADVIQEEVKLITFNKGLIKIVCKNGDTFCGLNVIISTGEKPKALSVMAKNIYYSKKDLSLDKIQNLVILGSSKEAIKTAVEASKTCRQIFICTNGFCTLTSLKTLEKVTDKDKIKLLENVEITSYKIKDNYVQAITLDTFVDLPCDALITFENREPDINIYCNFLDTNGKYYDVNDYFKFSKVPNVFAIGKIVKNYKFQTFKQTLDRLIKEE